MVTCYWRGGYTPTGHYVTMRMPMPMLMWTNPGAAARAHSGPCAACTMLSLLPSASLGAPPAPPLLGSARRRLASARTTSVKTCEALRDSDGGWKANSPAVCAESKIGQQCSGRRTHAAARSFCHNAGARVCSYDELIADAAADTGCELDNSRVWTGTCVSARLARTQCVAA